MNYTIMEGRSKKSFAVLRLPHEEYRVLDYANPVERLVYDGFRNLLYQLSLVDEQPNYIFSVTRPDKQKIVHVLGRQIAHDKSIISLEMILHPIPGFEGDYSIEPACDGDDMIIYPNVPEADFNKLLTEATESTSQFN